MSHVTIVFSDSGRKKVGEENETDFSSKQQKRGIPKLSFFYKEEKVQRDSSEDHLAPKKQLKKKKKKKKKQKSCEKVRRSMFDEELDKYSTYEEYLDSLVSEEDHKYLEDEEMARQIAELGYRSVLLAKKMILTKVHSSI